jgi:hypothetical protein
VRLVPSADKEFWVFLYMNLPDAPSLIADQIAAHVGALPPLEPAYRRGVREGVEAYVADLAAAVTQKTPVTSVLPRGVRLLQHKSDEELLNQREVAAWFGVDVSWVKNHCTRTQPILPFITLGGGRYMTRRFRRSDLLVFLAEHSNSMCKIS